MLKLHKAIEHALGFFFPQNTTCYACSKELDGFHCSPNPNLCSECHEYLQRSRGESCRTIPYVDGTYAPYAYTSFCVELLHNAKYHSKPYLFNMLARQIWIDPKWEADVIVPTPLYSSRMKERRYNQSYVLARRLSLINNIPTKEKLLTRTRDTGTQTALTKEKRIVNVLDAFTADHACAGLNIVIVDDIVTTGSTLKECARALKEAGASKVYAVTVFDSEGKSKMND